MCSNNTAGSGDPFWYEWSVGLKYAIKMLNEDNQIRHIKLQATDSNSLDDVVVEYESGTIQCIQVKHTRADETLSFASLAIKESDKKPSILKKLSNEWKRLKNTTNKNIEVIVFTNKTFGDRKYNDYPPLKSFYTHLKNELQSVRSIDDIKMSSNKSSKFNFEKGWDIWKNELHGLNGEEKLEFLNNFSILAEQENLKEMTVSISKDLSEQFNTSLIISEKLRSYLCKALMEWSTTLREKEEITKEDVMQALSLKGDGVVGVHQFPICEPFFSSRVKFASKLEQTIISENSNVTFLEGSPGSGKTNIINYLSSKIESIVTVRFYVFKPILAGDFELSADKGISDPKAFWGSLLIMFRDLFVGRLYEYKVPISIELIDSVDKLRSEVLRLAKDWSEITGKETVIVIDGIDHAARVGVDSTFLSTLPYGDGIPNGVKILITGQPIHQYHQYPDFLADENLVNKVIVPNVEIDDVEQLYYSKAEHMQYSELDKNLLIKYIAVKCQGNTLSVVFALQEATKYNDFESYEKNSGINRLANGVHSYYSYLWESSLKNCSCEAFPIDMRMVAIFSLINKSITINDISVMYKDTGLKAYEWQNILSSLFPIIICEDNAYKVFHFIMMCEYS